MSNNAAPQSIQSSIESNLLDLAYFIEQAEPGWLPIAGHVRSVAFTLNDADKVIAALRSHASLKARCEELTSQLEVSRLSAHNAERAVDVLESNARVQAKLLADTGRRVEAMEAVLAWLDRRGGLGYDAHERIRAALPHPSTPARG